MRMLLCRRNSQLDDLRHFPKRRAPELLVSATLVQFGYPSLDCLYYFTRALRACRLILAGPVNQNFVLTPLYDFYGRVHDANTSPNEYLRQVIHLLRGANGYAGALPVS